jgi:hypothetical protein
MDQDEISETLSIFNERFLELEGKALGAQAALGIIITALEAKGFPIRKGLHDFIEVLRNGLEESTHDEEITLKGAIDPLERSLNEQTADTVRSFTVIDGGKKDE